jgi:hypothetical protein
MACLCSLRRHGARCGAQCIDAVSGNEVFNALRGLINASTFGFDFPQPLSGWRSESTVA